MIPFMIVISGFLIRRTWAQCRAVFTRRYDESPGLSGRLGHSGWRSDPRSDAWSDARNRTAATGGGDLARVAASRVSGHTAATAASMTTVAAVAAVAEEAVTAVAAMAATVAAVADIAAVAAVATVAAMATMPKEPAAVAAVATVAAMATMPKETTAMAAVASRATTTHTESRRLGRARHRHHQYETVHVYSRERRTFPARLDAFRPRPEAEVYHSTPKFTAGLRLIR